MTGPCVIDTSVLVTVSQNEPDASLLLARIADFDPIILPATVYLEFAMVTRGRPVGRAWLDAFIARFEVGIHPIGSFCVGIAADAFQRYGKGTGHPAQLNFGDCLAYAAARELGAPLLFKGADFAHTDIGRSA